MRHPAHEMTYDELHAGLESARVERLVWARHGPHGLVLYIYSDRCIYDALWTPITIAARGLVLDTAARRIAATPFPKFFNLGERGEPVPDLPFEAMEKLDGSLVIVFHHAGRWMATTKGAFDSGQAAWAQARLDSADLGPLAPGVTYLAEAVYPENRIVVRYTDARLVMLGAYDALGCELSSDLVARAAAAVGWPVAKRFAFASMADLLAHAQTLPRSEEGFVLRFSNGLRLKVKGAEYRRVHALISRVTPLAMWEAMAAGDDLEAIRRELPEEFWGDFDAIVGLLQRAIAELTRGVAELAASVRDLSDKELGLRLTDLDPKLRGFLFPFRKSGGDLLTGRTRQLLFKSVRPVGNVLSGYVPSYAMNRVLEEAA